MSFKHDGGPGDLSIAVREHLDGTLGQRSVGRGTPVSWQLRWPYLTPLIYLFGDT